jgi:hypothetical protein
MARACLALTLLMLWGCASPPASPTFPAARPLDDVRRIAIVVSGDSAFTVAQQRDEPGRTIDEILKWHPWGAALRPVAKLVHRAINSLRDVDRVADASRNLDGISSGPIVIRAMAQALESAGGFADVRTLEHEPRGDGGPADAAAVVRVTVSAWGITQVRQDDPDLVASFADVRAQMAMGGTGVVLWTANEDVTHPEPAPLASFVGDRTFARDAMVEVLELAGQRLANEMLYARSARQ